MKKGKLLPMCFLSMHLIVRQTYLYIAALQATTAGAAAAAATGCCAACRRCLSNQGWRREAEEGAEGKTLRKSARTTSREDAAAAVAAAAAAVGGAASAAAAAAAGHDGGAGGGGAEKPTLCFPNLGVSLTEVWSMIIALGLVVVRVLFLLYFLTQGAFLLIFFPLPFGNTSFPYGQWQDCSFSSLL